MTGGSKTNGVRDFECLLHGSCSIAAGAKERKELKGGDLVWRTDGRRSERPAANVAIIASQRSFCSVNCDEWFSKDRRLLLPLVQAGTIV